MDIPATVWKSLSPFATPLRKARHHAVYDDNGEAVFFDVSVDSKDMLTVWPASEAQSSTAAPEEVAQPVRSAKKGRRAGSGKLEAFDEPLIEKALQRTNAGEQQTAVLKDLAKDALGGGTPESKADRLRKGLTQLRKRLAMET